jgi:uncharacterized lipoprotein NlpE involved in copper resistance
MKRVLLASAITLLLIGCDNDASIASRNLSTAADNFEINRRVIFYNGITDSYMLTIEGRCSLKPETNKLKVTCKTAEGQYKKHYLGLSDNVTYFAEQLDSTSVSVYHYRIVFKPQTIAPAIDLRSSVGNVGTQKVLP